MKKIKLNSEEIITQDYKILHRSSQERYHRFIEDVCNTFEDTPIKFFLKKRLQSKSLKPFNSLINYENFYM
jgi:hypothetical protein